MQARQVKEDSYAGDWAAHVVGMWCQCGGRQWMGAWQPEAMRLVESSECFHSAQNSGSLIYVMLEMEAGGSRWKRHLFKGDGIC